MGRNRLRDGSTSVVGKLNGAIDATQRKLIIGIVMATLLTLAIVIADLAIGGRPDPPTLRAAATLLDGAWRFHTGDDPHWADPNYRRQCLGDGRHDRPARQPRRRRGSARLRRRLDGARSPRLSRLRLVPAHGDGAGRTRLVGHPRADTRRGRLRTLLERPTARRVGPARRKPACRRHTSAAVRTSRRCGGHPWRARGSRIHAPDVRAQRRRRRHAQPAHTGSPADQRCAPPRAMAANHRRLHRRRDRAARHAGTHRLGARVPVPEQSTRVS